MVTNVRPQNIKNSKPIFTGDKLSRITIDIWHFELVRRIKIISWSSAADEWPISEIITPFKWLLVIEYLIMASENRPHHRFTSTVEPIIVPDTIFQCFQKLTCKASTILDLDSFQSRCKPRMTAFLCIFTMTTSVWYLWRFLGCL